MKRRVPLQLSPQFRDKLKEIQKKFKVNGEERSLRDLSSDIIDLGLFDELEKRLNNTSIRFVIKMDRRGKR